MEVGNGGFTQGANASGPVAGFDKRLFKGDKVSGFLIKIDI
jgi:hypothetical protein